MRKKRSYKELSRKLKMKKMEVSLIIVAIGALGTVGEDTIDGLRQIGLNEEKGKKVVKRRVKEIAKMNGNCTS